MLEVGDIVTLTRTGRAARIDRLIGEGSQGTVFSAGTDLGSVAVKWYFPTTGTAQQRRLIEDLIDREAPDHRFLWPSELVERAETTGFGYAMPLRPDSHAGLAELLTGKVDVPFSMVCRLALELCDAFLRLHAEGLCYRDISFSNVFFDTTSGMPLICDNDNVGIDGASPSAVLGTRRFMAPEIVRREASPSAQTDLYSLSVLLFYILMMGHPLIGRRELEFPCWDDHAESVLFGQSPLFVFDPADSSNGPVPELHDAVQRFWALYPEFLRTLFVQAFTRGLHDAEHGRIRESVWRSNLARLRDCIVQCTCGKESFVDPNAAVRRCWFCDRIIPRPSWLRVEGRAIALSPGATLSAHHLRSDYDFDTVIGSVVAHPTRQGLLGLRNMTDSTWEAVLADGETHEVEPGRSIRMEDGATIDLGPAKATVTRD